ncbi:MAG: MmcQ/YjbR family DNA-binding protein [Rhizobiales bacterium]|uniref:MmcQ/YjbR family DNA-binding protein n=1 Tax=Xanthobacter flavus TaxID=281 RepID=UPI001AD10FD4|nr:MmcQ/YjbR family DNA-binding protein [Hyphomicrobiales bacterium]
MAVDAARVREMALALPEASEAPHVDRRAFRTPRKIFATLGPSGLDLNLMFDPDLRDFYCEQVPDAFAPVPGGWGRMGATRCDLTMVDAATLASALQAAHRLAAPKAKSKPKRRTASESES